MPFRTILTALFLTLAGGAIGQISVVASIAPYGDLVGWIGGENVEVDVMLPRGASPHTFEPTPRDATRLGDADLVLLNGGTDEWLREIAEAINPDVPIVEGLEVLADSLPVSENSGAPDHSHFDVNPHVWLDPVLMVQVVEAVGDALVELDPRNAAGYRQRVGSLAASLSALDGELREMLGPVRGAPFIPFHDAWPYFARRYGLDLVMEIEPFPGREPSPRYLVNVVGAIRESGAPAIFNEVGLSSRAAEVLANEAGVEVATLDPLGRSGESYADLMRKNAATILEALRSWKPR